MEQDIDKGMGSLDADEAEPGEQEQRATGVGIIQLMGFGLLVFTFLMGVMGILMVSF